MKLTDVASKYGFDPVALESWAMAASVPMKKSLTGKVTLDEGVDPDAIAAAYSKFLAQESEHRAQSEAAAAAAAAEKQQALSQMLITSGFSFDGYRIVKYSGYISGDDAVQISRGREGLFSSATDVGEALMSSLVSIRRKALSELKEAAYELGCNAVIGVDFDYLTLDPETVNAGGGTLYLPYVFGVTANGNAVVIEPVSGPAQ